MFTYKITKAFKELLQEDNKEILVVNYEILDGKKVVATKSNGFEIGTDSDFIKAELEKSAKLYEQELENKIKNKAKDELDAKTDAVIASLMSSK